MTPATLIAKLRLPVLLAGSIGLLLLMLDLASKDAETLTALASDSPMAQDFDYYITDMSTTRFSATGQPAWRLQASRVTHYPDGDIARLDNPRFSYYSESSAPWQVTADNGTLSPDAERGEDRLELEGDVLLWQAVTDTKVTEITTEFLTVFTDSEEVATAAPVLLVTPGTRLQGIGMRALLVQDFYELLNSVRGSHAPLPR